MTDTITIKDIARVTNGSIVGDENREIAFFATDSRSLPRIKNVMFVAISGPHHNGNDFIENVYKQGIRNILTDETPAKPLEDVCYCVVKNSLEALQQISAYKRDQFKGTVIAITGSNGKTIVKEWLYQVLQRSYRVVRSPRSFNSQLGVPLSLWQLSSQYEIGIIEAGISKSGEMQKLENIIHPDIGILTNIGPAHRENFRSESQKLEEKLILFKNCRKLIYNKDLRVDGRHIQSFLKHMDAERIEWSSEGDAAYAFHILERKEDSTGITLRRGEEDIVFDFPFHDKASLENGLNVIVCLLETGLEAKFVQEAIKNLEPVEMRLQSLKGLAGSVLLSDVYNSDLAGLGAALDVLDQQQEHKKKAVILSDVYQSGMETGELYKEVADLLAFRNIAKLFLVGNDIGSQKHVFPDSAEFYKDTDDFLRRFDTGEIASTAVLIKGARKFAFERITQKLQLKFHNTVLEININDLIFNLNYYRSLLHPDTKIMVMVKALSYGTGGSEIAGYLQHEKVDYLAVAYADEGIRLRKAGIHLPVMVMNSDETQFKAMLEYDLQPELYSRESYEAFVKLCKFMGKTDHPVHLKFDTGMHRLGFGEADMDWLCSRLEKDELQIESIFTHLASSENAGHDAFTREQFARFDKMATRIQDVADYPLLLHVLNSSGIERFPEYQFGMVRIGIGLYGLGLSKDLIPVSTFKTRVTQVRNVAAGETVGYGRSGKLTRDSRIAVIPVGYADGIDMRLGNGNFAFHLNGKRVPTVGNICMDMTMLDVTDAEAAAGDEVELFGSKIPVREIAGQLDTIVYEVITGLPERVKRVYIKE